MPLGANKAAIMGVSGVSTADVVLIASETADGDASIEFTGLSSTYGEYIFKFYNIHPQTDARSFSFQFNASGQSGYNETITSTSFQAFHTEGDYTEFAYHAASDQAQGTSYELFGNQHGNDTDESAAGELHIFNPSSTTYVTHFIGQSTRYTDDGGTKTFYTAGYVNATAAITDVSFKFDSGNIDLGTIKLWGVK